MNIEELRIAIETYPQRLALAMEEVAKAEQAIEQLEEQIEEAEAHLTPEPEENYSTEDQDKPSDDDIQERELRLEYELSLLELQCEQIKGEIELEYRHNPPPGDKVTEATVSAFVKSNARLVEAKERCLEKKYERDKASLQANMSRRAEYAAERIERRKNAQPVVPATSLKLGYLQEELDLAHTTLSDAERKLEEVKTSIVAYQLLVQLYTAGLIN